MVLRNPLSNFSLSSCILENAGNVTAEIAKSFAESEFEKYRPIQDRLYQSDFDREIKKLLKDNKKK